MKAQASKGDLEASLSGILLNDAWHREALELLRETAPFAWITGGFVRNAIWDFMFGKQEPSVPADVDVIYLDAESPSALTEKNLCDTLSRNAPGILWSVKDQSHMHVRSNDPPYRSLDEAVRAFPDRSSAIAVRLLGNGRLETLAPFGLEDSFRGVVRPTPAGTSDGRYQSFLNRKLPGWRKHWPHLMVASAAPRQARSRTAA
jgi:hypothetical protein